MQYDRCALSDAKCNFIVLDKYKDISSLNYTQFIQTLKREVRFEDKHRTQLLNAILYYGVALPPIKRARLLSQT
ncbi:hypothetical protein HBH86_053540 [Parastagonospora nodorum]|nr:hypothetical protein HBH86_053540 [Parastagonospora nodorum]KAH4880292.1 hypothetical protein HBH59_057200 [Parastagonospora nodorum]KAH4883967.1 hypothetical protein HBH58_050450 [Parastagonospora nodorum]